MAALVISAFGLSACGQPPAVSQRSIGRVVNPAPGGQQASADRFQRAVVAGQHTVVVRASPDDGGRVVSRLATVTPLGSPRVLLALRTRPGWVEVSLPQRPNGLTGWVRAARVRLEPVPGEVVIDLRRRTMQVTLDGRLIADTPVAIGTARHPTPTGRFYVTDRVRPTDPRGTYGTFALGLSAYSPTLTEFAGRDGQVGIHGTNDPASIGRAASHGCVRVPDGSVAALRQVPLGTPVLIR